MMRDFTPRCGPCSRRDFHAGVKSTLLCGTRCDDLADLMGQPLRELTPMTETPDSMAALERDFCSHLVRWGIEVMSKWNSTSARLRNTLAIGAGWDPARAQEFIDRVNALDPF